MAPLQKMQMPVEDTKYEYICNSKQWTLGYVNNLGVYNSERKTRVGYLYHKIYCTCAHT